MALTALQVRSARPGRHCDGKGLYLLVKPSGAKSWVLRVVVNRRRCDFGLGAADLVTLQEAREKALEGRKLAKAGINPSAEWRRVETVVPTFEEAARRYHAEVEKAWRNGKHGAQWLTTLESYVFPSLGAKRVSEIDAPAIQAALVPIWLTIPETARRVRQRIAVVLDYSRGQGWRETEAPMRAVNTLMKRIKQPSAGNFAALPWEELPALVKRIKEAAPTVGRLALRFCLMTASRPGNVRSATWAEIDLDAKLWNIPAHKMKSGKPHNVPLAVPAVAILEEVRHLSSGRQEDPVFPGTKGKRLSDATLAKAFRLAGGTGYTVHGTARSSFRDWIAEQTSFPGEWAEAALAHAIPKRRKPPIAVRNIWSSAETS